MSAGSADCTPASAWHGAANRSRSAGRRRAPAGAAKCPGPSSPGPKRLPAPVCSSSSRPSLTPSWSAASWPKAAGIHAAVGGAAAVAPDPLPWRASAERQAVPRPMKSGCRLGGGADAPIECRRWVDSDSSSPVTSGDWRAHDADSHQVLSNDSFLTSTSRADVRQFLLKVNDRPTGNP